MCKQAIVAAFFIAAAMLSGASVQAQTHLMPVSPDPEATGEGFSPELKQAIAEGAKIPLWEVDSFVDKQRVRIDLAENLERDFPNTLSGVWMDDYRRIHVSATSEDVLQAAEVEVGGIETHLVKYSYQDLIDIKDRVVGSLQDLSLEDGSFVGIDPINIIVSIGYNLLQSGSNLDKVVGGLDIFRSMYRVLSGLGYVLS